MQLLRTEVDGQVFGTTPSNTIYKSMNYHRFRIIPDKTLWLAAITRLQESEIFEVSENNKWQDQSGHWWVGHNLDQEVGMSGELFGFFPNRSNFADPAHGYPVSGFRNTKRQIPNAMAQKWEADERIRRVDRFRIKSGKI